MFQTSAPGMLVNPTVTSKLNTNSFPSSWKMVGSQIISVDNNRGKWGARVTVPLQLEGNSARLDSPYMFTGPRWKGGKHYKRNLSPLKKLLKWVYLSSQSNFWRTIWVLKVVVQSAPRTYYSKYNYVIINKSSKDDYVFTSILLCCQVSYICVIIGEDQIYLHSVVFQIWILYKTECQDKNG